MYDFDCKYCNITEERLCKISERTAQLCKQCGNILEQNLSNCNKKDWFVPHINENFAEKPIFVESKEHMKKLCKEHGVYARCLM